MANNANSSDGDGENTWSTYSNNGNKTAKIVLKTFVVRAQNNTFRQQLPTDTISNKKKVIILLQLSTFRRFAAKYHFFY